MRCAVAAWQQAALQVPSLECPHAWPPGRDQRHFLQPATHCECITVLADGSLLATELLEQPTFATVAAAKFCPLPVEHQLLQSLSEAHLVPRTSASHTGRTAFSQKSTVDPAKDGKITPCTKMQTILVHLNILMFFINFRARISKG